MTKEKQYSKALKRLFAFLATLLGIYAAVIIVFDPFFLYHKPVFGDRTPMTDSLNQVPGSIRNFNYDSILVGDSLVENCNTDLLNNKYGNILKVTKESGALCDLLEYEKMAQKEKKLDYVLWGLDFSQLDSTPTVTVNSSADNGYIYTKSPLDDIEYLFNKEILFSTIPTMIYNYVNHKNAGPMAYNWADTKEFSVSQAMSRHVRPDNVTDIADVSDAYDYGKVAENLQLLTQEVNANPETEYIFIIPPVSMNYWDAAYLNGEINIRLKVWEDVYRTLLEIDNVRIFCYQNDRDIICNLNNYMDLVHGSQSVCDYVMSSLFAEMSEVTLDNVNDIIVDTSAMVDFIENEAIYRYYDKNIQ